MCMTSLQSVDDILGSPSSSSKSGPFGKNSFTGTAQPFPLPFYDRSVDGKSQEPIHVKETPYRKKKMLRVDERRSQSEKIRTGKFRWGGGSDGLGRKIHERQRVLL